MRRVIAEHATLDYGGAEWQYADGSVGELAEYYPQAATSMGAILATLTTTGAVLITGTHPTAPQGGTTYVITPFGRLLLERLAAAGLVAD